MKKLKVNENEYAVNQFDILQEEKKFYNTLNKSQKCWSRYPLNPTFFNEENITTLNDEEKSSCEGLVSEKECLSALKGF